MSKKQKSSDKNARVRVGNLGRPERELKNAEAENVRGGAGAPGGVLGDRSDQITNTTGR